MDVPMMIRRVLPLPPLPAIIAAALVLGTAGCGGSGDTQTSGAPAAPPSATENQINPQPRDAIQDGGTMTWQLQSMPPNFNYNQLDGTNFDNFIVISALMPRTFLARADASVYADLDYLASEPTLVTEPKQTVTYNINPKAVWSDGTPLSWRDFYAQWKANNGRDKRFQISASNGYDQIESVTRGHDDREVVVTFAAHFGDWKSVFSPLFPASTNSDPTIFNDGWKARPLVTAGPFKFDHVNKTAATITVVRDDRWWGNRAKLDTIIFRAIAPDTAIDALANGEIDSMDVGPDANIFNRAKAIEGLDMRVAGGPNFRHMTINATSTRLQDVRVRRALAMAIDRTTIARALTAPLGITPAALNNHIFMINQHGYQDNSGEVGKFDPAKAAALLDEAGWKLDGTVRKKNGQPLEFTCVIPTGVATSRQEAELAQNMLAKVGMAMKINVVPINDFFDQYITPGRFDVTVFAWIGTAFPISSSKSIYVKPTRNAKGDLDVQQNFARIGSDDIDRLYAEATSELDPQKAIELANRIDAAIWQEVHSLPLYQRPEIYPTKKTLANFGAFGFADRIYENIGWMKP
jgi:peptide/nickel transport system substrate-binding protein